MSPEFMVLACLLLVGIFDGLGKLGESVAHLSRSNVGRGVLEGLDGSELLAYAPFPMFN
jgi:hypothetical protein